MKANFLPKLVFLSILSFASFGFAQPKTIEDFMELPRADFLTAMEEIHEAAWPSLSLIFTRLDPAYTELLPPYDDWDEETKERAACVYDTMADKGRLNILAETILKESELADFVLENPHLNFETQAQDPVVQERYGPPASEYFEASFECGLLQHQGKQMQESGLIGALLTD